MANTKANVSAGKPKIGGAVWRAPLGTACPTNASTSLGGSFVCLGYVSEDGVTHTQEISSESVKAWGGDTVLAPQTGKEDRFKAKFIEIMNIEVLKTIFGNSNVTGSSLSGGISISANSKELDESVYVFEMELSGGVKKRIVIPDGKITEIGDTEYKDNDAVGYEATITALPDASENTHYEYLVKSST